MIARRPRTRGLDAVACPFDRSPLVDRAGVPTCSSCRATFAHVEVTPGLSVLDLRGLERRQRVSVEFTIPVPAPDESALARRAGARPADDLPSREEIRRRFGTKLNRTSMRHIARVADEHGDEATVLDLGCGAGNRAALATLGLRDVIAVDLWSPAADFLADAHRLPFADRAFRLVVATATVEHFANPFLAFREIERVLAPGGVLVATASFWESWHGSWFHATPGGLGALCEDAGLELTDVWSGWGFVASVGAHALGLARRKPGLYRAQAAFDAVLRLAHGAEAASSHRLRTSGSFGLRARKPERLGG